MESKAKGLLTEKEVREGIANENIEYVTVIIPGSHQVFCKRFSGEHFLNSILDKQGYKFCELVALYNIANLPVETSKLTLSTSTRDISVDIDRLSFRRMPWLDEGHVLCFGDLMEINDLTPRTILRDTMKKIQDKHGVHFNAASELEFYVLTKPAHEIIQSYPEINLEKYKQNNRFSDYSILTIMDRNESYCKKLKDNIKKSGINLEGLFSEHGPGQHEVNIKYDKLIKNCDNHIVLKECIKHTANKEGLGISFMAKTFIDKDGSSCHVHISCNDKENKNFFAPSLNEDQNITLENNIKIHKNMFYFIGGIVKYTKELFLIYAPTINSYKRFKKYSFAPTIINSWGYDSRLATVRLIGSDHDLRIEFRLCGADANPYLLLSALIASGMKGVEERIEPHSMDKGNLYEELKDHHESAPGTIYEAATFLKESKFAEDIFGKEFVELFYNIAMKEWEEFDNHVSAFEVNRYLDLA